MNEVGAALVGDIERFASVELPVVVEVDVDRPARQAVFQIILAAVAVDVVEAHAGVGRALRGKERRSVAEDAAEGETPEGEAPEADSEA